MSLSQLVSANGISTSSVIQPGQTLRVVGENLLQQLLKQILLQLVQAEVTTLYNLAIFYTVLHVVQA